MKVRVVDYVCGPGGGIRFVRELLAAARGIRPDWRWELATHGEAAARYAAAFGAAEGIAVRDVPPVRAPRPVERVLGIPGSGRLRKWLARRVDADAYGWAFEGPPSLAAGCDVCWFPWIHRHRPPASAGRTVGTLHDVILVSTTGLLPEEDRRAERGVIRDWLASPAILATGSRTARGEVSALFAAPLARLEVIPPAYAHAAAGGAAAALPADWGWARGRFVLYAANTFPHKNHETLLRGVALWGRRAPLVLTGHGADAVADGRGDRGRVLKRLAEELGFRIGADLIAPGYVPDAHLAALTAAAWAACVPTRAEGGGSFPAQEALLAGVPLVCSDIPVLREQFEGTGAPVLWFDPRDPEALAARLRELEADEAGIRAKVRAAGPALARRTWRDAAEAYATLFERAAGGGA
jgi:glycosyltransferase involved in cell wall biosynthesis